MKKTAFYENKPQKEYSSLEYSRLERLLVTGARYRGCKFIFFSKVPAGSPKICCFACDFTFPRPYNMQPPCNNFVIF